MKLLLWVDSHTRWKHNWIFCEWKCAQLQKWFRFFPSSIHIYLLDVSKSLNLIKQLPATEKMNERNIFFSVPMNGKTDRIRNKNEWFFFLFLIDISGLFRATMQQIDFIERRLQDQPIENWTKNKNDWKINQFSIQRSKSIRRWSPVTQSRTIHKQRSANRRKSEDYFIYICE